MQILKTLALFFMVLVISQCRVVKDESSPFFTYPKTVKLVLNQEIPIPPTEVSVLIQFGKLVRKAKRLYPYCELEVRKKNDIQVQNLSTGEFPVSRVVRETYSSLAGRQLASLQLASAAAQEYFTTRFILPKDSPSNIRHLACQHMAENNLGEHLSLPQIRQALGELIHIRF